MTTALTPAYDRINVLTGQARMFTAAWDAAALAPLPAADTPLGGDWDDAWAPVGATQQGLTFAFTRETTDIMVEEQPTPVDVRTNSLTWNMNVVLSEDTLETMRLAYGGARIDVTPATATTFGLQRLVINPELEYLSFAFEARNKFGLARRVRVPVCVSVGEVETTYRRAESQRLYNVSIRSLVAPQDVDIVEQTPRAA